MEASVPRMVVFGPDVMVVGGRLDEGTRKSGQRLRYRGRSS